MVNTRSKRPAKTAAARAEKGEPKARKTDDDDRDAGKTARSDQKGSIGMEEYRDFIDKLLGDGMLRKAYPSVDRGKGEKDIAVADADRPKPLPKENAGQMDPDGKRTGKSKTKDVSTGRPRGFASDDLTPFEHLICAAMLSKPLSHRLQLRTIATLFSPPFGLNTPQAIHEAGYEGCHEALYEARTQHKDKTAVQSTTIVDGVYTICRKGNEDAAVQLDAVRKALGNGSVKEVSDRAASSLTEALKGFGKGGADIFLRRIQAEDGWQAVYPFLDARAARAARKLGLVDDTASDDEPLKVARQLADRACGPGDEAEKRRRFVRLVDVIVGLDLEKQIDAVLQG